MGLDQKVTSDRLKLFIRVGNILGNCISLFYNTLSPTANSPPTGGDKVL
jgi:hypothetical protein